MDDFEAVHHPCGVSHAADHLKAVHQLGELVHAGRPLTVGIKNNGRCLVCVVSVDQRATDGLALSRVEKGIRLAACPHLLQHTVD
ncbi:hypothetical protein D3C72_2088210 [compost metagenome]